jgi:hypothetical protein
VIGRRSLAALPFALVVVAACGGPTPTEAPPATTAPATPSPAGATASSAARDLPTAGPLEPGRYTRSGFEPPITFDIDDGWSVGSVAEGFFDVQQRSGTPEVVAVQFGRVDGVIGADGAVVQPGSAEQAAGAIADNPAVEVLGQDASRLGGLEGHVVEVENDGTAHAAILEVPAGRLGVDPGRRLWIALFDTTDGVVAVMVGGSSGGWDEASALAEPVLESVAIGD